MYLADGFLNAADGDEDMSRTESNGTLGMAKRELIAAGMAEDAAYFGAGHSLGGIVRWSGSDLWQKKLTHCDSKFCWLKYFLSNGILVLFILY